MTVYHGGLTEVRNPEIRRGGYVGDFGIGFYVTSSHEQATRFVRLKGGREDKTSGVVSVYELDERLFSGDFKGLAFDAPTREWAQFVSANRKRPSFSHDYDYVRGPVANDQVYTAFALYEGGILTFEMLIEQLKTRRLFDQILFHTPAAIGCLKFIRSEVVTWRK